MHKPLFVGHDKLLKKINPNNIICLYTRGNYTKVFLTDKTFYMVWSTMSNILKKLPPDQFVKIHRLFALPISKSRYRSLPDKLTIIE